MQPRPAESRVTVLAGGERRAHIQPLLYLPSPAPWHGAVSTLRKEVSNSHKCTVWASSDPASVPAPRCSLCSVRRTRVVQEGHENGVRQTSKEKNHCSHFTDRRQARNARGTQSEHPQEGAGSSQVDTGRVGKDGWGGTQRAVLTRAWRQEEAWFRQ